MSGKPGAGPRDHLCSSRTRNPAPIRCRSRRWLPNGREQISAAAGGGPVIGKSVRKIILEIIGSGKAVAADEDGHVAVVIMETGDLQFATRADLALRSQLLVLAALQDRASPAPEQRGKSIQFIQRSRQRTPGLRVTRFQRSGAAGHRSKNQRGAPVVGNANIDFRAWAYGRCRGSEAYQDVLAAIAESHPVAEG